MERNPVFSAVWAILGVAVLSLWLYWSVTVARILWGGVLVLLFFITQQLVLLWRRVGSSPLEARWWKKEPGNNREDKDDPWKDKYYRYIFIALMMIWVFLTNHLYKDLPAGPILWLFFALMLLVGSIRFILSSEGKKIVQAPVSRPLGLHRWIDLYASADPVPNGPTRTIEGEHDSKLIWNLGSLFADHTAYWNNRDGFVLRVARVCAETAKSPWTHGLPDESDFIDKRAAWRVGFLRVARWSSGLTWLVLGVLLWRRHQANVPVPFNLPSWVPAPLVQHALFVLLIALAMWATSSALCWIWSWWVWAEQEVVLDHEQPGRESDKSFVGNVVIACMAMVVSMLIATVVYMLMYIHSWADLGDLTKLDTLGTLIIGPFLLAFLCMYLPNVMKCRPPDASKRIGTPLKT